MSKRYYAATSQIMTFLPSSSSFPTVYQTICLGWSITTLQFQIGPKLLSLVYGTLLDMRAGNSEILSIPTSIL